VILYLHGFRSGPQSTKAQQLAARLQERGHTNQYWCAQLSSVPFTAMAQAEAAIRACRHPPLLVGSSLGGFYAAALAARHGLQAVLVNPFVLTPGFDFSLFLGEHTWFYQSGGFTFTAEHARQLTVLDPRCLPNPQNLWLLTEEGDEVLDYRHAVARFAQARQSVLPGGNHGFSRWADYIDAVIETGRV
jgi:uncharacterized protein